MKLNQLLETVKLPKRYPKTGVGKWIGGALYLHRDYESVLPQDVLQTAQQSLDGFDYNIVKYVPKTDAITFIQSPDFDSADEPMVGPGMLVKTDGSSKIIKPLADPWIYHHKWLWVKDDYPGFDVNKSKERSMAWMSLPDIDYARIGKKSFWEKNVVPHIPQQKVTEAITNQPHKFIQYTQNRIKDLERAKKLSEHLLSFSFNGALGELFRDVDRYVYGIMDNPFDLENLTRESFYENSIDLNHLKFTLESFGIVSNDDIGWLMKSIEYFINAASRSEEKVFSLAQILQHKDDIQEYLKNAGWEEDIEYEEEAQATKDFNDFLNSAVEFEKLISRVIKSKDKYQVILDKYASAFNPGEYRPKHDEVETLWHTTIYANEIAQQGFQKEMPKGRQGLGSYGTMEGISFTHSKIHAIEIQRALRELSMVVNGSLNARQILSWIKHEGIDLDQVKRMMDGKSIDDTIESNIKLYNVYLWTTEIRNNPVFANIDKLADVLQGIRPSDIGIIQANINMSKVKEYKKAENEFLVPVDAILKVKRIQ